MSSVSLASAAAALLDAIKRKRSPSSSTRSHDSVVVGSSSVGGSIGDLRPHGLEQSDGPWAGGRMAEENRLAFAYNVIIEQKEAQLKSMKNKLAG